MVKETKLKERLDKAAAAFWDESEKSHSEFEMTSVEDRAFQKTERTSGINFGKIFSLLKQIFLFLPGTFITFYMWMGAMIFGLPIKALPLYLGFQAFASLLMVLGIGKVRNSKHWLIPLSVVMAGLLIGLIPNIFPFTVGFFSLIKNVIFLFSIALITGVLTKNLVEISDPEKID